MTEERVNTYMAIILLLLLFLVAGSKWWGKRETEMNHGEDAPSWNLRREDSSDEWAREEIGIETTFLLPSEWDDELVGLISLTTVINLLSYDTTHHSCNIACLTTPTWLRYLLTYGSKSEQQHQILKAEAAEELK